MALLDDMTEGHTPKFWAETMSIACDLSNMCVTTANEGRISPYEKWHGTPPDLRDTAIRHGGAGRVPTSWPPRGSGVSCWALPTTTLAARSECKH